MELISLRNDLVDDFAFAVLGTEFGFGSGGAGHGVVNVEAFGVDVEDLAGFEAAGGSGDGVEDAGEFALGVVVTSVA